MVQASSGSARRRGDAARPTKARAEAAEPEARSLEDRVQALETKVSELTAELVRSEARVEAMKAIGRALGSSLDLDHLLDEIVRKTTELLEADRSTLFLVDQESGQLWSKVLEGEEHREIAMPIGAGVAGWVAKTGRRLLIPNAYGDHRFDRSFDKRSGYRTREILTCPVRRPQQGGTIGVIQVLNKREGRFDQSDERMIEAIASEIGVALEVSALYREAIERTEALERARGELALLFETERAISQSADLAEMLGTILETAVATMGSRSGALHLLDDDGTRLRTLVARGVGTKSILKAGARVGEGVAGSVVRTNEPVCLNHIEGMTRGRVKVRSVVAVPIRNRYEGVLGALELLNTRVRSAAFDDDDVRTLTMVAAQAGRAIVAERRRVERAREERLSAIGQMLSGILHDFRTPMTLISGYTQIMAGADERCRRDRFAGLVDRQIALLTSMTKDLLAFARGERSILIRKVHLNRFMEEMQEYLQRELESSSVQLDVDVRYRGAARFDETKMRRVFHNITRNAREAMPEGGRFWVSVDAIGGELVFRFADDGPGIPSELEHRLFEPFATAGKVGGTGLGLTMVRQIAEEHEGRIEFGERNGGGVEFVLAIPLDGPTSN